MIRVGLISDTHGLLRPEALQELQGVDHILHAGDIGKRAVIDALAEVAPVAAIRGNVDKEEWANEFPETKLVEIHGVWFYLVHARQWLDLDPQAANIDIVVVGHSHKPSVEVVDEVTFVNPGSAGPRRFNLPVSLALMTIHDDRTFDVEIRSLAT